MAKNSNERVVDGKQSAPSGVLEKTGAGQSQEQREDAPQITQLVVLVDGAPGVTTPTTIFEYELPVLEAVHGEEMVHVHSEREVDVPEGFSAVQAHSQLLAKYPAKYHDDVKRVYPTAKSLARASGLDYKAGDNQAGRFNQAVIRDHSVNRNSDASLTGADLNDPHANQGQDGNLPVSDEAKQAAEQQRLADAAQRKQEAADAGESDGED